MKNDWTEWRQYHAKIIIKPDDENYDFLRMKAEADKRARGGLLAWMDEDLFSDENITEL